MLLAIITYENSSTESDRQFRHGGSHGHPMRPTHLRVADNAGMVMVMGAE